MLWRVRLIPEGFIMIKAEDFTLSSE